MFNRISQFCQSYYDQIPAEGLKATGVSALTSFVACTVLLTFGKKFNEPVNLSRVILAAGIASLASVIRVITTPIFNYLFDNPNNDFNGFQELAKTLFDITLTQLLINNTTALKVNLITAVFPLNGNFIILPHNIIKGACDISVRAWNVIDPTFAVFFRDFCTNKLGMDFNTNPTPIYVAI